MPAARFVEQLNAQIGHEFAAHQQYVACAVHYDLLTMPQMASFFYRQAVEERDHAMMMVQYLVDCDASVIIPAVAAPQSTFQDIVEPVRIALDQERRVAEQINALTAVAREASVEGFYAYASASSHTGFEAVSESRLYLYQDLATGALSLVTHHGIDIDATGLDQPKGDVKQTFSFLPSPVFVAISDDTTGELAMSGEGTAKGDWTFHHNTDGGVLAGFPSPGSWSQPACSACWTGSDR